MDNLWITLRYTVHMDKPEYDSLGKSWKDAPDWCDDCVANPGEKCPDCGYTHNC